MVVIRHLLIVILLAVSGCATGSGSKDADHAAVVHRLLVLPFAGEKNPAEGRRVLRATDGFFAGLSRYGAELQWDCDRLAELNPRLEAGQKQLVKMDVAQVVTGRFNTGAKGFFTLELFSPPISNPVWVLGQPLDGPDDLENRTTQAFNRLEAKLRSLPLEILRLPAKCFISDSPISELEQKPVSATAAVDDFIDPINAVIVDSSQEMSRSAEESPAKLAIKTRDALPVEVKIDPLAEEQLAVTVQSAASTEAKVRARARVEAQAKAIAQAKARVAVQATARAEAQAKVIAEAKARVAMQARAIAKAKASAEAKARAEAKALSAVQARAAVQATAVLEVGARQNVQEVQDLSYVDYLNFDKGGIVTLGGSASDNEKQVADNVATLQGGAGNQNFSLAVDKGIDNIKPNSLAAEKRKNPRLGYGVQVGVYQDKVEAMQRMALLNSRDYSPFVHVLENRQGVEVNKVMLGSYRTYREAKDRETEFKQKFGEDAFVYKFPSRPDLRKSMVPSTPQQARLPKLANGLSSSDYNFAVQVGGFRNAAKTKLLVASLQKNGYQPMVVDTIGKNGDKFQLVWIGRFHKYDEARSFSEAYQLKEGKRAFVFILNQQ